MLEHLRQKLFLLKIGGAWGSEKRVPNILFGVLRYFFVILNLHIIIGATIAAYSLYDNISKLSNCIITVSIGSASLSKLYYLGRYNKEVRKILEDLESGLLNQHKIDENEQKHLVQAEKITHIASSVYIFMSFCSSTSWFTVPLWKILFSHLGFSKSPIELSFPLPVWLPFQIEGVLGFCLYYPFQMLSGYNMVSIWIGADVLMVCITMQICGHFSILSDRITHPELSFQKLKISKIETDEEQNIYFNHIIPYHLELIRLSKELENIFTQSLFHLQIGVTGVIACCGFLLLVSSGGEGGREIASFLVLCAVLCSWLVLCFFGTVLMTKSEEVSQAVYTSNWIDLPHKAKKNYQFILQRAQKPVCITAGNYFIVSLSLFLDIIQKSYSLLALLKEVLD